MQVRSQPRTYRASPSRNALARGGVLQKGQRGASVKAMQEQLAQVSGMNITPDGMFGAHTEQAVRQFQRQAGISVDGKVGPQTLAALKSFQDNGISFGAARPTGTAIAAPTSGDRQARPAGTFRAGEMAGVARASSQRSGQNLTASFDRVRKAGTRGQMVSGKITVNGNTYDFNSGGGGRGNLPAGDYKITRHLNSRRDKSTMMRDGVGYSFAMSDKYDPRVGDTRKLLRIHPDGGRAGTIGCIGIVGNGDVQRQFRDDMNAEIRRNGGSVTLKVG